jgi:uncharacterized protein YggE
MLHPFVARSLFTLLFISALLQLSTSSAQTGSIAPPISDQPEISVTGDALISTGFSYRIALQIEQSEASADKAAKDLDSRITPLQSKLAAMNPKVPLELVTSTVRGAGTPGQGGMAPIRSGQPVVVRRLYTAKISQLSQVGAIVDLLNQPGVQILEVEQVKHEDPAAINSAITLASQRGRESAEKSATALNVKLGPLISSTVTVEPDGAEAQERMMKGGAIGLNEINQRVFVNLRYSIAR